MSATQQVADLPLPVPVQLRKIAEIIENTSSYFRSDAEKARAMASRIEAREAMEIQNVR